MKNWKTLIEYLQTIDVLNENFEDYNDRKKNKVLIVFNDMMADIEPNKKLSPIVTELFLWGKKLIISYFTFLYHSLVSKWLKL